jgi:PHD/YefM family antitoxin component YafN of YafNO toxin-antitoxin module
LGQWPAPQRCPPSRHGKKAFVVRSHEEFLLVEAQLQEYEDLKALRAAKAKEATARTVSLAQARRKLGV